MDFSPQTDLQEPDSTEQGQAADETLKEEEAPEKEREDGAIDGDDDDPSTSDFHGFEDCAGDQSVPAVLSPDTGKTEFEYAEDMMYEHPLRNRGNFALFQVSLTDAGQPSPWRISPAHPNPPRTTKPG